MILCAICRRVTRASIASFSMWRWASASGHLFMQRQQAFGPEWSRARRPAAWSGAGFLPEYGACAGARRAAAAAPAPPAGGKAAAAAPARRIFPAPRRFLSACGAAHSKMASSPLSTACDRQLAAEFIGQRRVDDQQRIVPAQQRAARFARAGAAQSRRAPRQTRFSAPRAPPGRIRSAPRPSRSPAFRVTPLTRGQSRSASRTSAGRARRPRRRRRAACGPGRRPAAARAACGAEIRSVRPGARPR